MTTYYVILEGSDTRVYCDAKIPADGETAFDNKADAIDLLQSYLVRVQDACLAAIAEIEGFEEPTGLTGT